jgi:hypothetical protein
MRRSIKAVPPMLPAAAPATAGGDAPVAVLAEVALGLAASVDPSIKMVSVTVAG